MKLFFFAGVCLWIAQTVSLIVVGQRIWRTPPKPDMSEAVAFLRFTVMTNDMILKAEAANSGQFFIHMPPSGCPAGWDQIPDLFENDGVKHDGCGLTRSVNGIVATDYIAAKETFNMPVPLPPEIQEWIRAKGKPNGVL